MSRKRPRPPSPSHVTRPQKGRPWLTALPLDKEFFPTELHATLDGEDEEDAPRGVKKRRVLELSEVTTLKSAEDIFGQQPLTNQKKALEQLERFEKSEKGQAPDTALDMMEDDYESEEQDYDDDEDGDYNAEGNFDNGEDDEDDHGDDDEPVADY